MKFVDYPRIEQRDETAFDTGETISSVYLRHNSTWSPSTVISFSDEGFLIPEHTLRLYGWLLYDREDPLTSPLLHRGRGWVTIDDDYNIVAANPSIVLDWLECHALSHQ